MTPQSIRGIAAMYAILALVTVAAGFGAWAAYNIHGVRGQVRHIQTELGDQNLTRIADRAIAQAAQQQGFAVVKIVELRQVPKGADEVRVYARVTVVDPVGEQQTVELVVTLDRGVWTVSGMAAA